MMLLAWPVLSDTQAAGRATPPRGVGHRRDPSPGSQMYDASRRDPPSPRLVLRRRRSRTPGTPRPEAFLARGRQTSAPWHKGGSVKSNVPRGGGDGVRAVRADASQSAIGLVRPVRTVELDTHRRGVMRRRAGSTVGCGRSRGGKWSPLGDVLESALHQLVSTRSPLVGSARAASSNAAQGCDPARWRRLIGRLRAPARLGVHPALDGG